MLLGEKQPRRAKVKTIIGMTESCSDRNEGRIRDQTRKSSKDSLELRNKALGCETRGDQHAPGDVCGGGV